MTVRSSSSAPTACATRCDGWFASSITIAAPRRRRVLGEEPPEQPDRSCDVALVAVLRVREVTDVRRAVRRVLAREVGVDHGDRPRPAASVDGERPPRTGRERLGIGGERPSRVLTALVRRHVAPRSALPRGQQPPPVVLVERLEVGIEIVDRSGADPDHPVRVLDRRHGSLEVRVPVQVRLPLEPGAGRDRLRAHVASIDRAASRFGDAPRPPGGASGAAGLAWRTRPRGAARAARSRR